MESTQSIAINEESTINELQSVNGDLLSKDSEVVVTIHKISYTARLHEKSLAIYVYLEILSPKCTTISNASRINTSWWTTGHKIAPTEEMYAWCPIANTRYEEEK